MRLLLDTHALLWTLQDNRRLGRSARRRIEDERSTVWVSAASIWELSIKAALGRVGIGDAMLEGLSEQIQQHGFEELPVTWMHGIAAGTLPPHHADPFDRMLIAQAKIEELTLVTADEMFAAYDVRTLAADA
jgi:PIN domain nuclease of toxin-antitoxin system